MEKLHFVSEALYDSQRLNVFFNHNFSVFVEVKVQKLISWNFKDGTEVLTDETFEELWSLWWAPLTTDQTVLYQCFWWLFFTYFVIIYCFVECFWLKGVDVFVIFVFLPVDVHSLTLVLHKIKLLHGVLLCTYVYRLFSKCFPWSWCSVSGRDSL